MLNTKVPTVSFRPSNGDEGAAFMARFCDRCERDAAFQRGEGDSCPIVAAAMIYDANDPKYPPEWVEDDVPGYWNNPRCTAYVPENADVPIDDSRQMLLGPTDA